MKKSTPPKTDRYTKSDQVKVRVVGYLSPSCTNKYKKFFEDDGKNRVEDKIYLDIITDSQLVDAAVSMFLKLAIKPAPNGQKT